MPTIYEGLPETGLTITITTTATTTSQSVHDISHDGCKKKEHHQLNSVQLVQFSQLMVAVCSQHKGRMIDDIGEGGRADRADLGWLGPRKNIFKSSFAVTKFENISTSKITVPG